MSSIFDTSKFNFELLSERFKYFRATTGLSQSKLAKKIGTSQSTIRNIESNHVKKITDLTTLKMIEKLFGINSTWLLEGEGEIYISTDLNNSLNSIDNLSLCLDNIKNNAALESSMVEGLKDVSLSESLFKIAMSIVDIQKEVGKLVNQNQDLKSELRLVNKRLDELENKGIT